MFYELNIIFESHISIKKKHYDSLCVIFLYMCCYNRYSYLSIFVIPKVFFHKVSKCISTFLYIPKYMHVYILRNV